MSNSPTLFLRRTYPDSEAYWHVIDDEGERIAVIVDDTRTPRNAALLGPGVSASSTYPRPAVITGGSGRGRPQLRRSSRSSLS